MTKEQINWKPIKKDYILGVIDNNGLKHFPTSNELAKNYPPSEGTIRNKASEEKWMEQRKSHKFKVTKKAIEKKCHVPSGMDPKEEEEAVEHDAEAIVKSDEDCEATGEKLRQLVELSIDNDLTHVKAGGYVKAYNLKMYGDALSSAQGVIKAAQGEITDRIKLDSNTDVNLTILNDDFQKEELSFMQKLIKK